MIFGLYIAMLLSLLSCGGNETGSSGVSLLTSPFIGSDDIAKPDSLATKTLTEVLAALREKDEVYANAPDSEATQESGSDPGQKCVDELLKEILIEAEGERISLGAELSLKECFDKSFQESGSSSFEVTVHKSLVRFFMVLVCPGKNMSGYNGKSFTELDNIDADEDCTDYTILSNMAVESDLTMEVALQENSQVLNVSTKGFTFQGNNDLGACSISMGENGQSVSDSCQYVTVSNSQSTAQGGEAVAENDYIRLNPSSLVRLHDKTSRWYKSGKMNAEVNGWTGSLTYNGPGNGPAYDLRDPEGNSQTGTLTASALRLSGFPATGLFRQVRYFSALLPGMRAGM